MLQSILQISELLRKGPISPVELTTDCLARIEKLNPKLNAFISVTAKSALAAGDGRPKPRFGAAAGVDRCTAFLSRLRI